MTTGERLAVHGLALPPGHTLVAVAEQPALRGPMGELNAAAWPEFMLHDGVVAAWDGTDDDLPVGWDDQLLRTVAGMLPGSQPADTLGALQIVVRPSRQGEGYAGIMLQAMRAIARSRGDRAVIACVRPTHKALYPLTLIERYALWTRDDGLPLDPWIRLHVRLGGRVVRGVPASMTIRGTVAEWCAWTGLEIPESGLYLPAGAAAPVQVDTATDLGVYCDPNVWVVHDLRGSA